MYMNVFIYIVARNLQIHHGLNPSSLLFKTSKDLQCLWN